MISAEGSVTLYYQQVVGLHDIPSYLTNCGYSMFLYIPCQQQLFANTEIDDIYRYIDYI